MRNAEWIELACLAEATARKPGNVHPGASFVDLRYQNFVDAAVAIAEPLADVTHVGIGRAIHDAVVATREATGTNVNLGIILLIAPLAAVPYETPLKSGIAEVLKHTTVEDAEQVFAAIRHAQPGGLGKATSQDVSERASVTLREAMSLAAGRDQIAEQYVTDFSLVFGARDQFRELMANGLDWEEAVIALQLWMLSRWPDTLIARKCGPSVAEEASARARKVIEQSSSSAKIPLDALQEFDAWLRGDGHRRNPGTTADLIAAALFAAARDRLVVLPSRAEIGARANEIENE